MKCKGWRSLQSLHEILCSVFARRKKQVFAFTAASKHVLSLHSQWGPESETRRRSPQPPVPRRRARTAPRTRPIISSRAQRTPKPWSRRRRAPSSPRDRFFNWRRPLTWRGIWAARRERASPAPCSSPRRRSKSGFRTAATSWRDSYPRTWRARWPLSISQRRGKTCNHRLFTKTAACWADVCYPCLSPSCTRLQTLRLTSTSPTLANALACLMQTVEFLCVVDALYAALDTSDTFFLKKSPNFNVNISNNPSHACATFCPYYSNY